MGVVSVNPTGFVLNGWANGELAYDGDNGTGASIAAASDAWTPFIEFTHEPMYSYSVEIRYFSSESGVGNHTVDIDIYYNGAWNHLFENLLPQNTPLGVYCATRLISAFRVRLKYSSVPYPNTTVYMSEVNFYATAPTVTVQAASNITSGTATGNGTITYANGSNATKRGFYYSIKATIPEDADFKKVEESGDFGAEAFSLPITGLLSNTKYYIRTFATNGVGTSVSSITDFTTLEEEITVPVLTTPAVSDILMLTATGKGNITDTGGENATKRGVCYNLTGNPTIADSKVEETGTFGTGAFTEAITGLTLGTKYYVKPYAYNSAGYGYGEEVNFTTLIPVVTTQDAEVPVPVANPAYYEFADGNGTIVSEINATERGFEIKHEVSGTLYNNIDHGMAGFEGDTDWDIDSGWYGTLIKIEHEHGDFEEGAFTLVLGDFPAFAFDKLFAGESYTYRAYAVISGVKYYEVPEKWVAFSLGTYTGADALPNPGGGDSPFVPIVEPIIEPITPEVPPFKWPEEVFPPYTVYPPWSYPPFTYPPWEWPGVKLPPWKDPTFDWSPESGIDPSIIFGKTFSAFLRGLDTKKDWETLREKCIIYQENMNQDTLTINHNTTVLKNTVNDIIEYVKGSVYASDLVPMNSCQQLTPLYQEEISPNGFKDIINDFRLKDVNNTYVLNENFMKLLNSLNSLVESDYRIEPISYNTSEYIDIEPTAKRMILQLSDMDKKFKEVRRLMALNFKRIFLYI